MVKALKSTGVEIMVVPNTYTNLMYGAMSICCVHRDNKHLNFFLWRDTPWPKKLKAPGKALEIPGKHGKSWETSKDSGKSWDIFLVLI